MPEPSSILAGLTLIAERAQPLAIAWHVAFAALAVLWLLGRLSGRSLALALSAPLLSVALCAAYFGNPFNALVFGASALFAGTLACRSPSQSLPRTAAVGWARVLGAALLAFGWVYPHFLAGPAFQYLYAAPLGTIPCPTLSAVIGVTLLGNGLVGRGWSQLLAGLGCFYAVFGAARLGVTIDVALLAGALGLLAQSWHASPKLA